MKLVDSNTLIEIRDALVRIADALEAKTATPAKTVAQSLQERADYNREHAGTLYSDKLAFVGGEWYMRDTHTPVKFTPYGWVANE